VLAGEQPIALAGDRYGRISVRIALRQMKSQGHASAALSAWLAGFDQAAPDEADDDTGPASCGLIRKETAIISTENNILCFAIRDTPPPGPLDDICRNFGGTTWTINRRAPRNEPRGS
jgi:hypothetical protein